MKIDRTITTDTEYISNKELLYSWEDYEKE
jgi:hypothetical protein